MTSSTPNEGISTPWAAIAGVTFVLMLTFLFIAIGYTWSFIKNDHDACVSFG